MLQIHLIDHLTWPLFGSNFYHLRDMNQQTIRQKECAKDARGTSSASSRSSEELNKANIILTNRGLQRYRTWSAARLLELITSKFKQFAAAQSSKKTCNETTNERRLWVTIHSGLYSTIVLKILLKKGMSVHTIIKAMKLGLISLSSCELSYFKCFNIYPYMLEFENMWTSKYNPELISNLRAVGMPEPDCWHIIIYGVGFQSACILRYLMLSGIDIPGILNWQSPVNRSSEQIILFLKHIGIEQEVIELAEQYGIDEETEQILADLGLEQMEESSHEIICKCSLTVLEPDTCNSGINQSINKVSESDSSSTVWDKVEYMQYDCQCDRTTDKNTVDEFTAQRNDYLRKNVMVPIAWAMARTLKYKPSNPLYYMTYELMRWKYINPEKKEGIQNAIALATVKLDHELLMKWNAEKEELIKSKNEEALANIPCLRCRQHQELHATKQACLKCMKKPQRKPGDCEFPEICSACKIEPSSKLEACQFPEHCSSCDIINNPSNKPEGYGFPNCCDFCRHTDREFKMCAADPSPQIGHRLCQSEIFKECRFSQVCSSCKVNDIESKNLEACEFPQVCSSCKITKP